MKRKISLFIFVLCSLFCVLSFKTKAIIGTYKILEYNVDIYTNGDASLEFRYNIKYQVLENYGYPINGFSMPIPEGYYLVYIMYEENPWFYLDLEEDEDIETLSKITLKYTKLYDKDDIVELNFTCIYDTYHYDNEYHYISYNIIDKTIYNSNCESYCINWHTSSIKNENIIYNNADIIYYDDVYTWTNNGKSDYDYIEIAMEFSKEAFSTYTFDDSYEPFAFNIAVILFYVWFLTVPAIILLIIILKKKNSKKKDCSLTDYNKKEDKESKDNDEFSIDQSQYEISDEDY